MSYLFKTLVNIIKMIEGAHALLLFTLAGLKKTTTIAHESCNSSIRESQWEFTDSRLNDSTKNLDRSASIITSISLTTIEASITQSVGDIPSKGEEVGDHSNIEQECIIEKECTNSLLEINYHGKQRSGSEVSNCSTGSNNQIDGIENFPDSQTFDESETRGTDIVKKGKKKRKKQSAAQSTNKLSIKSILRKEDGKKVKKLNGGNRVSWGFVSEILFSRIVALSSVPNKGAFPIGLGDELRDESGHRNHLFTVNEHFQKQQESLRERSVQLGMKPVPPTNSPIVQAKKDIKVTKGASKKTASGSAPTHLVKEYPPTYYESRQYDFSPKINPLFQPLSEYDRIALLVDKDKLLHGGSHAAGIESALLSDANKDVKSIQASRQGHGCSCKPVKIDKLSVAKMRSELIAHGSAFSAGPETVEITSTNLTSTEGSVCPTVQSYTKEFVDSLCKTELTHHLREVLKLCLLCLSNSCECFQLGMPW